MRIYSQKDEKKLTTCQSQYKVFSIMMCVKQLSSFSPFVRKEIQKSENGTRKATLTKGKRKKKLVYPLVWGTKTKADFTPAIFIQGIV